MIAAGTRVCSTACRALKSALAITKAKRKARNYPDRKPKPGPGPAPGPVPEREEGAPTSAAVPARSTNANKERPLQMAPIGDLGTWKMGVIAERVLRDV